VTLGVVLPYVPKKNCSPATNNLCLQVWHTLVGFCGLVVSRAGFVTRVSFRVSFSFLLT
jgi:hypothetical protein